MQVFRITLRDGIRKFRTTLHAPDAAAAETKAAYYFDTSKWQILSVTHTGALSGPDFCFIFAPCGYDEPEILPP